MNGKSLMMLGLAVVFGLGAMMLTRQMLSKDAGKRSRTTQEVLVAARDIKEEESLKPDMVRVISDGEVGGPRRCLLRRPRTSRGDGSGRPCSRGIRSSRRSWARRGRRPGWSPTSPRG